jgi:CRP-like cAMP-binding protein
MEPSIVNGGVNGSQRETPKQLQLKSDGLRILEGRLIDSRIAPTIARELVNRSTTFDYSKGSIIFSGAPAEVLYCVRRGLVGLYVARGEGSRIMVRIAGAGDLLGSIELGDEKGRSPQFLEAHARSNCQLALISHEHILRTLQAVDRNATLQLLERINTEWFSQMTRRVRLLGLDYRQRLGSIFGELAERFGIEEARGVLLTPELSHSDFAEMIGSSRQMTSKLIAEMIERSLLIKQGRQYIVARKYLAQHTEPRASIVSRK